MERNIFETEHNTYRSSVRTFMEREVAPNYDSWDRNGIVPRQLFKQAAELGAFAAVPEEYGGAGLTDFRCNAIFVEEAAALGVGPAILGPALQADICMPYLLHLTNEEQRRHWLPAVAAGEKTVTVLREADEKGSVLAAVDSLVQRPIGTWSA